MGRDEFRPAVVFEIALPDGTVIKNPTGWRFSRMRVCPHCGQTACALAT